MPNDQLTAPRVFNAGVHIDDLRASTKAAAGTAREVSHYHNLAVDPAHRYEALFPLYGKLREEAGPDLDERLAQLRRDLLRSIAEDWDWRWALEHARTWEEYACHCDQIVEESLAYLRAEGRVRELAGGSAKRLRRILRIVITQVITSLEAARLSGLE
jgi:hypothetical protein